MSIWSSKLTFIPQMWEDQLKDMDELVLTRGVKVPEILGLPKGCYRWVVERA